MTVLQKYLFGPVPSRRLGRSLGIDLIPMKTCSLNCVFCQLGPCDKTILERREYTLTSAVISEIQEWLNNDGEADCITLSGSGEPTLHTGFGKILRFIKQNTNIQTVLLTNSTLLHLADVRKDALSADIIKVSLSAWNQESFDSINRPAPGSTFDQIVEGLIALRADFSGEIWMEVFLIPGLNTLPSQIQKIAKLAATVSPNRIQLNTAVRPPAESFVHPVPEDYITELADLFQPRAEIIASFNSAKASKMPLTQSNIARLISRHPATISQLAQMTGNSSDKISRILSGMDNQVSHTEINGERYFQAPP